MAHWHDFNPWADRCIYVPSLEELLDITLIPEKLRGMFYQSGTKVDAYLLPLRNGNQSLSFGVRYGKEGCEYYSHNVHPLRQDMLDYYNKHTSGKKFEFTSDGITVREIYT